MNLQGNLGQKRVGLGWAAIFSLHKTRLSQKTNLQNLFSVSISRIRHLLFLLQIQEQPGIWSSILPLSLLNLDVAQP